MVTNRPALLSLPLCLLAACLAGCGGQASLERWKSVADVPPYAPPELFVASAPSPEVKSRQADDGPAPPAANEITININDKQAAQVSAKHAADGASDAAAGKHEAPPPIDLTTVSRVLMAGVERSSLRPGDRLLLERIKIRLDDPGYVFTNYELASTDREKVDIGSLSVTDTRSAGLTATGGNGPLSATASLSAQRQRQASRGVSAQAEFSVSVSPHEVDIYRTGVEGQDLTGNTLVKLAIRLPPGRQIDVALARPALFDDKGAALDPAKARIDLAWLQMDPPRPITATGTLHYEDRDVTGGANSLDEGQQAVEIRTGECQRHFVLVPAEDLAPPLWAIVDRGGGELRFASAGLSDPLRFDDYRTAKTFLAWMRLKGAAQLANGRLEEGEGVGAHPPNFAQLRLVRYRVGASDEAAAAPPSATPQTCRSQTP